ncbi:hypothetical protein OG216_09810 [Streptomycetaceae bacterium NBC_01309]
MIRPGQVYRSCNPRGPRIQVTGYTPGAARAHVADADTGGRVRQILVRQLHATPMTEAGRPRRTGYVLEADPT